MDKKLIFKSMGIALVLVLCALAFIDNYNLIVATTNRISDIFDISNLKNWFQNYVHINNNMIESFVTDTKEWVEEANTYISNINFKDVIADFTAQAFIILLNFFNYFINIGINVIFLLTLMFRETFHGTNETIKYSKSAIIFIKFKEKLHLIVSFIKNFIKKCISWLKTHKRKLLIIALLILVSNGFIYTLLVEIIIFLITYVIAIFKFEAYLIFSDIGKSIFILSFPLLKQIPLSLFLIILILLIFFRAFKRANFKLEKNHERLKIFTKDKLTQTTFINGAPGVGKTLLNVSLSLASEENMIEELEDKLINYQMKYPNVNFAEVRNKLSDEEHLEYLNTYEYLKDRKSYMISNFSIYSPYFKDYSKIFDFNFMRKNIKSDVYALEAYTIISLSELDKEYNSHDDMKTLGMDGAATFFSTVSHDLKRTAKIFCDYQLKDQVPLRIRGNAEYFLTIKDRKRKYPFLLYLYYLPFIGLFKFTTKLIKTYESKRKTINKKTKRKSLSVYKRNDYTLIYGMLRSLQHTLAKINKFFDRYWYFKLTANLTQEDGGKGTTVKIYLNLCDLNLDEKPLYDSTFLSHAYEQKKNKDFKDLDKFTSLTPEIAELTMCHSRFYDKINNIESDSKINNTKDNKKTDDEFIEV